MTTYSVLQLPTEERPRERFVTPGAEYLTTVELIAILLGSGTKERPVLQLAQAVVTHFGGLEQMTEATIAEFLQIKGLGPAKAIQLKAALSLGFRASRQKLLASYRIDNPIHVYHFVKDELENEKRELFLIILQDVKGNVMSKKTVAIGTLSNALVHPREVFHQAVRHAAASIILVHNHPSGDPTPSQSDFEITETLIQAGRLMGIPVNDHLIIGLNRYISLRQQGLAFQD